MIVGRLLPVQAIAATMRPFRMRMSVVQEEFIPGQRWLSEAEPDLGLGLVEEVDDRHVRLNFAASGQSRNYAALNAPLSRVRFAPDDRVQDKDGQDLTIRAVEEVGGLLVLPAVSTARASSRCCPSSR